MRGAVWITYPEHLVMGETALAGQSVPIHAHTFQLVDPEGEVHASGCFVLRADEDEIAHELFRFVLFMLPDDEADIDRGKLWLRVNGRTYTHGPCNTTAYIPDEVLYRRNHSIIS